MPGESESCQGQQNTSYPEPLFVWMPSVCQTYLLHCWQNHPAHLVVFQISCEMKELSGNIKRPFGNFIGDVCKCWSSFIAIVDML